MKMWRKLKRNKAVQCGFGLVIIVTLFHVFKKPKSAIKSKVNLSARSDQMLTLLVLVMTGPKNQDQRDAMRKTWLKASFGSSEVSHYFVIGTKQQPAEVLAVLDKEQAEHQDLLLLEDFQDAYERLTEKLALMLEWADKNLDFQFLFKADDDTYAILDTIVNELKSDKQNVNDLFWGYFYGRGRVKKSGPWKETSWKLCDYYLPYARGGGYVLSRPLVSFVAENWRQFQLYNSEDVSMGTWLAPLKLTRVHDIRFDTEYKSRGCKNKFIVCHKQTIANMYERHENLKLTGKLCQKETLLMNGYTYNWDVPPSQCCTRQKEIP